MDIQCQRCGARIAAADVDLANRLAKCRSCDAVFDFSAQVERRGGPLVATSAAPLAQPRPVAPLPDGITVLEDVLSEAREAGYRSAPRSDGRLLIKRSWYSPALFFLAFFCLFWDGFLVVWYSIVLGAKDGPGVLFIVFPLLHVGVGVGLTYRTLAGFVNRTWISIASGRLTVRHGPLPWFGARDVDVLTIEQLYIEEDTMRNKNSPPTHSLSALLRDGKKLALLKSMPFEQAIYLELKLEEHLGISPAPVAGEALGPRH